MVSAAPPTSAESALVSERRARTAVSGAAISAPDAVPVISLAPFLAPGGSEADRVAVAAEWDAACRQVGFVKIVDHGVPPGVIDKAWDAATAFFRLPLVEKASVAMTSDYPYGYQAMGTENLEASLDKGADANPGDVKEMFNICIGSASANADVAPVRWPAGYPAGSRAALAEYYSELEALSSRLYDVCALALGLPAGWFAPRTGNHRNVIRAIHYPAQQTPPEPGQVRASTHTDYGSLTILRLGGSFPRGLQAMGAHGEWIDVSVAPGEDAFVINLGDLMARWTNDRWLSTPHRVVNPPQADGAQAPRQSLAYFCNIDPDALVVAIPTCVTPGLEAKYQPCTAGEHLTAKHTATVAGRLCYVPKKASG